MNKMTLLLTILCISGLNGMEMDPEWKDIANASNQKDFIKFVHILADKSNISTYEVAQKVNTDTAKKYIKSSEAILYATHICMKDDQFIFHNHFHEPVLVTKFDDIDVNYTRTMYNPITGKPLIGSLLWHHINSASEGTIEIVRLLLKHGAIVKEDRYYIVHSEYSTEYFKGIKSLLAQARVNQQEKSLSS